MIILESKRRKPDNILKKYPSGVIVNITSLAKDGFDIF